VFLLLIYYFTLRPWPLTFDLEHLQCIACEVMKLCSLYQIWTQSINPRQSYCDFNIWPDDLERRVTYGGRLWYNFHVVWPSTTYRCLNYSVFWCWYVMSRCDLDLWPLTLKVRGTSSVTWSVRLCTIKSVGNLSEIEQSAAELLMTSRFFLHTLCRSVTLTFDLLILNFYSTSTVMCLNSVQYLSEIE